MWPLTCLVPHGLRRPDGQRRGPERLPNRLEVWLGALRRSRLCPCGQAWNLQQHHHAWAERLGRLWRRLPRHHHGQHHRLFMGLCCRGVGRGQRPPAPADEHQPRRHGFGGSPRRRHPAHRAVVKDLDVTNSMYRGVLVDKENRTNYTNYESADITGLTVTGTGDPGRKLPASLKRRWRSTQRALGWRTCSSTDARPSGFDCTSRRLDHVPEFDRP